MLNFGGRWNLLQSIKTCRNSERLQPALLHAHTLHGLINVNLLPLSAGKLSDLSPQADLQRRHYTLSELTRCVHAYRELHMPQL